MNPQIPPIKIKCKNHHISEVIKYIHCYWQKLIKSSPPYTKDGLFYLPYPYVVPGGVFQQLFYWDSYFTILGLKISRLDSLAKGIVNHFLYELKTFGIIPNSSNIPHLSRSQPPFLTSMFKEVWNEDLDWLRNAFEWAKIEYKEVWMNPATHYHKESGLNKYYDNIQGMLKVRGEAYLYDKDVVIPQRFWQERTEAESGWDYTGRFHHQCGYYLPVDLNSLLYKYEVDFSEFSYILELKQECSYWKERASIRKQLMNRYLWNSKYGMYFDFNFITQIQYPYYSLTTFFPLWSRQSSFFQAKEVSKKIPLFLQPGGMVTSTVYSGFQWDYPNGWAPLQWIVIRGLKNYGYDQEAKEIAIRWIRLCTQMFLSYGTLFEKYNVVESNIHTVGRYPLQEGFGWTNAVYEKIAVDILGCKVY